MYAWQRRSKKPLLPPRPTDFDDVLKSSESAKRLVLEEEEEMEKNALPRLENARASSPSLTVGDGEEGERCEEGG